LVVVVVAAALVVELAVKEFPAEAAEAEAVRKRGRKGRREKKRK
jgi:hypothetical protein